MQCLLKVDLSTTLVGHKFLLWDKLNYILKDCALNMEPSQLFLHICTNFMEKLFPKDFDRHNFDTHKHYYLIFFNLFNFL